MSLPPLSRRSVLALISTAPLTVNFAHAEAQKTIRVGIMAGEDEDVWRVAAENAAKAGLLLKIIPFSDYNAPNEALQQHELDANAFQHGPFLEAQKKARNYTIVPVGNTYFAPISLYSTRWKSPSDLPQNAKIGVPNDPSNEGRALHLLQSLGVIKLSDNAGLTPTALDIADNPGNITIQELDAGMVGRALPDLDAAVVNTDWALKAGIDVKKDSIGNEGLKDNPYINFIAVNEADKNAPWVATLVKSYQQPNVHKALTDVYHGAIVPGWS